jgi:hypothetical protein
MDFKVEFLEIHMGKKEQLAKIVMVSNGKK